MRTHLVLAAILSFAMAPAVHAACVDRDALVADTTKIANRHIDVDKVTAAARSLAGTGAIVRVRVYDTLHGSKDINELVAKDVRECGWAQSDGSRLTNLLYVPLAVEHGDIIVATGRGINARLSEAVATQTIVRFMVPRWQSYKTDSQALTLGLVDMLDAFKVELSRPVGGTGTTTIVHNQASDTSWLKYLAIGIVLIGGGLAAAFFLLRSKQDSEQSSSVAAETNRIRADCRSRLLALNDEILVLSAKVENFSGAGKTRLSNDVASFKRHVESGLSDFRRFDPNPDQEKAAKLPVNVLLSNQQRYADIVVQHVEPAEALKESIEQALAGKPAHGMPAAAAG